MSRRLIHISLNIMFLILLPQIVFANSNAEISLNDYKNLRCPTPSEFKQLASEINLKLSYVSEFCDDPLVGRLGRLLLLLKELKVDLPLTWMGGAKDALTDPFAYLRTMILSVDLDFKQKSIASSNNNRVTLGSLFFKLEPLEAAIGLLHEARHSDYSDPNHTQCFQGEIPNSKTGCDARFKIDEKAGAYSYEVSIGFALAMYHKKLSASDRQFLIKLSFSKLAKRFNRVSSKLATPHDVLVVLDDEGQLYEVDPFLGTLSGRQSWVDGQLIKRIEFDYATNGILAWTKDFSVYSIDTDGKSLKFGSLLADKKPIRILDVNRLTAKDQTYQYVILENHKLQFKDLIPEKGEFILKDSFFQASDFLPKRIVLNMAGIERFVLDEQGILHQMGGVGGFSLSKFQAPSGQGWAQVYSSFNFQEILGLDKNGTLYSYNHGKNIIESVFQSKVPPLKVIEGSNIRAFLLPENKLEMESLSAGKRFNYSIRSPRKIVDATFIRRYRVAVDFYHPIVNPEFIEQCQIQVAYINPWTERGIGISKDQELVFEGPDQLNRCLKDKDIKTTSIDFLAVESKGEPNVGYSETSIVINKDFNAVELKPYMQEPLEFSR